MPKCKAIHYLAASVVLVSQNAGAEPMSYKEYMKQKRFPQLSQAQNYYQPQYTQPQYVQPAPVAPAPYVAPVQTTRYAQPQAQQQYAMRPPAPYVDTAVPQPQVQDIKRQPSMQAPQPVPQVVQPPYQDAPRVQQPQAEDEKILGGDITGSLGIVSDYTFRGVSQSKEGPAIQGGVEYQHEVGAYIGMWATNVDFNDGDEAQVEIDAYGGYRTAVTENLSADVGVIYYAYPGANSNLNYDFWEFYAGMEYGIPLGLAMGNGFEAETATVGASLAYSPEFFGESGAAYYAKATAALPFANGLTIDGHVGKQWIDDNARYALPDYVDWSFGVAYALPKSFEVKLQYIDTNIDEKDCADGCDAKAVATLSKSF